MIPPLYDAQVARFKKSYPGPEPHYRFSDSHEQKRLDTARNSLHYNRHRREIRWPNLKNVFSDWKRLFRSWKEAKYRWKSLSPSLKKGCSFLPPAAPNLN